MHNLEFSDTFQILFFTKRKKKHKFDKAGLKRNKNVPIFDSLINFTQHVILRCGHSKVKLLQN